MAGSVARIEVQTTVLGQYKDMMGIDEMEEDDLIIESKKPEKKKKVKKEQKRQPEEHPFLFPKWYKKDFLDSLEPKPEIKKPKAIAQELDLFTDEFFHHVDGNSLFNS